jgi:adenylyltransferase/sulfurtransferase
VWLGKPLVYGSVMRFEGQVSVFDAKQGPCYRCLFPEAPPPELAPNCAEAGVLGVLPGVIGLLQATEVIKLLLGEGTPLIGRLLVYDALAMEMRQFKLSKDRECAVCGENPSIHEPIDYEAFCAANAAETSAVTNVSAVELRKRMQSGEELLLIDVREQFEFDLARIEGSRLIPLSELPLALSELEDWRNRPIVVHCHHGPRSRAACELLLSRGFSSVDNLEGGIEAWSTDIDPSVSRY